MEIKELMRKMIGYEQQPPNVLLDNEAILLFELGRDSGCNGCIINIGEFLGKSAICLSLGSKGNGGDIVYSIDIRPSHNTFKLNKNTAGIKEGDIISITGDSKEIGKTWVKPIKLIFIDGNHLHDYVKEEFKIWSKHIIIGGIVAFHDTLPEGTPKTQEGIYYDVTKVFEEDVVNSEDWEDLGKVGSISYAKKVK